MSNTALPDAINTLVYTLIHNDKYYLEWRVHIAMAFYTEWINAMENNGIPDTMEEVQDISYKAADKFLKLLMR